MKKNISASARTSDSRNYGVDLLRIVSMVMVLILHVLGQGGALSAKPWTLSYAASWTLEIGAFCAVNCYALISGYVGYGRKFKLANLLTLWFEVVFYLLAIRVIFLAADPESVASEDFVLSFLPVSRKVYWYFTAYFGIYFFTPLFSRLLDVLDRRKAAVMVFALVFVFSVFPIFTGSKVRGKDLFLLSGGYSALWLAVLWLLGAFMKKYDFAAKRRVSTHALIYLACVLVTVFTRLSIHYLARKWSSLEDWTSLLVTYISPTVLLCGVSLMALFANLRIPAWLKGPIRFFAPATFGVYIIHLHPNIWALLKGRFASYGQLSVVWLVLAVLGTAVGLFIALALVDRLRIWLFRVMRIGNLSALLERKIRALADLAVARLERFMK